VTLRDGTADHSTDIAKTCASIARFPAAMRRFMTCT
jgi:hypothetical protein